ncbi:MAG: DUF3576 domain-containing protein [Pelagimonas sp.]|jgi:hypothetical protein|nr:DUF3576 domain-containing protein [Pelagimonas sp.]
MSNKRTALGLALGISLMTLSGCGVFGGNRGPAQPVETPPADEIIDDIVYGDRGKPRGTIWDLFRPREDAGQVGAVNRYIWNAALETLSFLPVESVDPFTGVITTGFGTPPGGGKAYRATIYVSDPALDARSLNVALMTRSGPAAASTTRAIEDAILTRARQIRARDSRL